MSEQEITEAQLGESAKDFLESDVGRMVLFRADADEQTAIQTLVQIDPYEYETLIDLQNAIMAAQQEYLVGQRIAQYVRDAIVNGDMAWQNLNAAEEV